MSSSTTKSRRIEARAVREEKAKAKGDIDYGIDFVKNLASPFMVCTLFAKQQPDETPGAAENVVTTPAADDSVPDVFSLFAKNIRPAVAAADTTAALDFDVAPNMAPVVAEQLSFDVIPAASETANAAQEAKVRGLKRVTSDYAKKVQLVRRALAAVSLFNEADAPIPEDGKNKGRKTVEPEKASTALAELLGMAQPSAASIDTVLANIDSGTDTPSM